MLKYIVHTEELFDILNTLYNVLGIGISFYDYNFHELDFFNWQKQSPFCRQQRENVNFLKKCKLSDYHLFEKAKKTGQIQIHKCHCNLFDGSVPLYDDNKEFLGIIIFGQVKPKNQIPIGINKNLKKHYLNLPQLDYDQMKNVGKLLKFTSENIVRQQLVGFKKLGWSEKIQRYIEMHLNGPIKISQLAEIAEKSESFISHYFKKEFGKSPAQYLLDRKMTIAKYLLQGGDKVFQVAEKLGFYDAYHFSKTFKKYFHKPPKEYKSK